MEKIIQSGSDCGIGGLFLAGIDIVDGLEESDLIIAFQNSVEMTTASFANGFVFCDVAQVGFVGGGEMVSAHGTYCHVFSSLGVLDGKTRVRI